MATQPPNADVRPGLRLQAPSLDVMAGQSSETVAPQEGGAESGAGFAAPESRSSSSTNSPAPNDNEESDFFLGPNDSESSLGVSNLQDMQVADNAAEDPCIPPVNRLPNELLISTFAKLSSSADLLHCMLTCKRWARNSVDLLWHRPACTSETRHESICRTLTAPDPYFHYRDFIKRLNLASIADKVDDTRILPLAVCNRIERLTLTNCKRLTDAGLVPLVQNSHHLLALDISGDSKITEATLYAIAEHCRRLQGLNVSGCTEVSVSGMIRLAEHCKYMKRIKLNDCGQLTDEAVVAFAENCPNILEIDLHQCRNIGNEPVTRLLTKGRALRELRLADCHLVDDSAFLSLPEERVFEHLRILDLTSCVRLTDGAVEKIISVAPRLRNLVLAKCRNITDVAVHSISRLGKNLHYLHLGHCNQITDEAVKGLVRSCNRIRYIDLGCCVNLTDDSVIRLANLPKLKRIGLVKCSSITDESVYALAKANQRPRQRRDAEGNVIESQQYSHSSLERIHLSYCTSLSIQSIIRLLNACHRLTHLSLTGVPAFLREDLAQFCRSPPPEFTAHQREMFCVFSGEGVSNLRQHLNTQPGYASFRERPPHPAALFNGDTLSMIVEYNGSVASPAAGGGQALNFDETEADAPEDDDEDGNDMLMDVPVLQIGHSRANGTNSLPIPIPIPPAFIAPPSGLTPTAETFVPGAFIQFVRFSDNFRPNGTHAQQANGAPGAVPANGTPVRPPFEVPDVYGNGPTTQQHAPFFPSSASTATTRASTHQDDAQAGPSTAHPLAVQQQPAQQASSSAGQHGASTASLTGLAIVPADESDLLDDASLQDESQHVSN